MFILQDGPCYPSNANVDMYKYAGQDLVTITNTSAIDCASQMGLLAMTFVTVRNIDFVMNPNPKAKEIAKTLFENFSNDMIAEEIGYAHDLEEIALNIKEFKEHNKEIDVNEVDYIEAHLPLSSDVEKFEATVEIVKDFIKLDTENLVGVLIHHFSYNQISSHFNVKKIVKFTNTNQTNQRLPELILATLDDDEETMFLIMKGILMHQELLDITARSIPTRILHALGAKRFTVISDIFGVDDELETGDIFLAKDHINLSVLNPTMGPNIDKWGKRFYDVSRCYNPKLIDAYIEEASNHEDVKIYTSGVAYTSSAKPYAGLAEKKFCKGIGKINGTDCKGISFQGYSELMTIRQMDFDDEFKTLFIGIIIDK